MVRVPQCSFHWGSRLGCHQTCIEGYKFPKHQDKVLNLDDLKCPTLRNSLVPKRKDKVSGIMSISCFLSSGPPAEEVESSFEFHFQNLTHVLTISNVNLLRHGRQQKARRMFQKSYLLAGSH